jgi:hypothetical protein
MSLNGRKIVRNTLANDFVDMLKTPNIRAQIKRGAKVIRCERKSVSSGFDPIALILSNPSGEKKEEKKEQEKHDFRFSFGMPGQFLKSDIDILLDRLEEMNEAN